MKTIFGTAVILTFFSICTFGQASAVKLKVKIPADSTEVKTGVFVAGSFNGWNPNDSLYLMTKTGDDLYTLEIPVFTNKKYEYKYTKGGWGSVELSGDGAEINNRIFLSHDGLVVNDTVVEWRITQSPKKDSALILSGSQVEQLSKLKSEMETKLAERIKNAGDLLKKASENMVSEKPDMELRNKFRDEIISTVTFVLEQATDLMWNAALILTPEQKKAIQLELSKPNAQNDIFNLISNVLVVPEKK